MPTSRPHDLLWLADRDALEGISEAWVDSQWRPALPVVVRRDVERDGFVPVGIRGMRRSQRAAGWVREKAILRTVSPEAFASRDILLNSPFISMSPLRGAGQLARCQWPWQWGVIGSVGYALATELPVMHAESDLDLLIRCPEPTGRQALGKWQMLLDQLPCRADTQIETPHGAFALAEWLREGRVLLKTSRGPQLVRNPWMPETEA